MTFQKLHHYSQLGCWRMYSHWWVYQRKSGCQFQAILILFITDLTLSSEKHTGEGAKARRRPQYKCLEIMSILFHQNFQRLLFTWGWNKQYGIFNKNLSKQESLQFWRKWGTCLCLFITHMESSQSTHTHLFLLLVVSASYLLFH